MKAKYIELGDVIEGWTVIEAGEVAINIVLKWEPPSDDVLPTQLVLLTLEADGQTRSAWYTRDQEVQVKREGVGDRSGGHDRRLDGDSHPTSKTIAHEGGLGSSHA